MQKEGYAGAAHMREFVEYLWGWDATATETVDDAMWKDVFDTYVEDKYKLGMKSFFEQKSPFAFQDMTARMLETVRKGYWHADASTLKTLLSEYVESVDKHGINCTEVSCANPQLMEYVIEQAKAAGLPVPSVEAFQKAVEQAVQGSIPELAAAAREFISRNEAAIATRQVPGPEAVTAKPTVDAAELRGYLMQSLKQQQSEEEKASAKPEARAADAAEAERRGFVLIALALFALLALWRWRWRHESAA
jgi:cobaltochelatase CobN